MALLPLTVSMEMTPWYLAGHELTGLRVPGGFLWHPGGMGDGAPWVSSFHGPACDSLEHSKHCVTLGPYQVTVGLDMLKMYGKEASVKYGTSVVACLPRCINETGTVRYGSEHMNTRTVIWKNQQAWRESLRRFRVQRAKCYHLAVKLKSLANFAITATSDPLYEALIFCLSVGDWPEARQGVSWGSLGVLGE